MDRTELVFPAEGAAVAESTLEDSAPAEPSSSGQSSGSAERESCLKLLAEAKAEVAPKRRVGRPRKVGCKKAKKPRKKKEESAESAPEDAADGQEKKLPDQPQPADEQGEQPTDEPRPDDEHEQKPADVPAKQVIKEALEAISSTTSAGPFSTPVKKKAARWVVETIAGDGSNSEDEKMGCMAAPPPPPPSMKA